MRYGQSEHFETYQQRDARAFREEIEAETRKNETGVRKGVRVLSDGTIQHYIERV